MLDYSGLPYVVEPMLVRDVEEIMGIEREAFSAPWSANAYRHELLSNELAHYYLVRQRHAPVQVRRHTMRSAQKPWRALLPQRETQTRTAIASLPPVLAYGGLWIMVDEAHISTIATTREWRGKGIGELLLAAMIEHAQRLGAEKVTLEVRVSNQVAQQLYRKYGFLVEGRRRRYYSDNGEDALIMTTPPLYEDGFRQALETLEQKLEERLRAGVT